MKIEKVFPKPPPEYTMTFTRHEGFAITAALDYYAEKHPRAADRDKWLSWARTLRTEIST